MYFLRLIRWPNLLIIAFTQYMVRFFLMKPCIDTIHVGDHMEAIELQMPEYMFLLMVLSTILIAAGGYIINDYFDIKIDSVNKPGLNIIGTKISRRKAIIWHWVISSLGILIAFLVSFFCGVWKFGFIHIICATGLWFYSTHFKRQLIIGNLLIAAFTGLVPILAAAYEIHLLNRAYSGTYDIMVTTTFIWKLVLSLSLFAFLSTIMREIIKDLEDVDGDKTYGCKTLPIVWGVTRAKAIATLHGVIIMLLLTYLQIKFTDTISMIYFIGCIQLPMVACIYKIIVAQKASDYKLCSQLLKVIMFAGVAYLFLFNYVINVL